MVLLIANERFCTNDTVEEVFVEAKSSTYLYTDEKRGSIVLMEKSKKIKDQMGMDAARCFVKNGYGYLCCSVLLLDYCCLWLVAHLITQFLSSTTVLGMFLLEKVAVWLLEKVAVVLGIAAGKGLLPGFEKDYCLKLCLMAGWWLPWKRMAAWDCLMAAWKRDCFCSKRLGCSLLSFLDFWMCCGFLGSLWTYFDAATGGTFCPLGFLAIIVMHLFSQSSSWTILDYNCERFEEWLVHFGLKALFWFSRNCILGLKF